MLTFTVNLWGGETHEAMFIFKYGEFGVSFSEEKGRNSTQMLSLTLGEEQEEQEAVSQTADGASGPVIINSEPLQPGSQVRARRPEEAWGGGGRPTMKETRRL